MNKLGKKMAAYAGKKVSEVAEEKAEQPIMKAGLKAMAEKLKAKAESK